MSRFATRLKSLWQTLTKAEKAASIITLTSILFSLIPRAAGFGVFLGFLGIVFGLILTIIYVSKKRRTAFPLALTGICFIALVVGALLVAPAQEPKPVAQSTQSQSVSKPKKQVEREKETVTVLSAPTAGSAEQALETLLVKGRAPKTGYDRNQFGPAWSDVDHNGCDTRNDILKRDLSDPTYKAGTHDCTVLTGTLNDPYTATTIDFERGEKTSSKVQIDHVVALSDAWQKGAQKLTIDQRKQLANDPYNLLAVDGPANNQKSDGDAATWLPSNTAYRCAYVARQIGVKQKYSLWVTSAEKEAMKTVLAGCPEQQVPQTDGSKPELQAIADQAAAKQQAEEEARKAQEEAAAQAAAQAAQEAQAKAAQEAAQQRAAQQAQQAQQQAQQRAAQQQQQAQQSQPSGGTAHGGAFCSPQGSQAQSDRSSNILTCKPAKDGRLRWQN